MLVERAQTPQGGVDRRDERDSRVAGATRKVVRVAVPRNLDQDLPGRRVAHGFNIGLTPVLFAGIGYGVDRALGTLPLFTVALALLSIVGVLVSGWYRYKASIEAEEAAARGRASRPGVRRSGASPTRAQGRR